MMPQELLDESEETIARLKQIASSSDRDTLQILLETISPVGRVLHDALNKQVYLETILLKAMREAHAVRIGDILNRLNQLRSAGELKFLEGLPAAARENNAPQLVSKSDILSRMSVQEEPERHVPQVDKEPTVSSELQAECIESDSIKQNIPAVEKVAAESVVEPVTEEVAEIAVEVAAVPESEKVSEEKFVADNADSKEFDPLERKFDEPDPEQVIAEQLTQTRPSARVPAPVVNLQNTVETESVGFSEEEPETVFIADVGVTQQLERSNIMEKLAEENTSKALAPDSQKQRRSIINDSVNVKRDIANDPEVAEILDLFGGDIIDVHR